MITLTRTRQGPFGLEHALSEADWSEEVFAKHLGPGHAAMEAYMATATSGVTTWRENKGMVREAKERRLQEAEEAKRLELERSV